MDASRQSQAVSEIRENVVLVDDNSYSLRNKQTEAMKASRNNSTFPTDLLTGFLFHGRKNLQRRREAFKRVESALGITNTWRLPHVYGNENREDQFVAGTNDGRAEWDDGFRNNHKFFHFLTQRHDLANSYPFGQHTLIFLPSIRHFASEEQVAHWLPKAERFDILGTYVQTELGHGTFVRGVETTATYDANTQEFVLDSPTPGSTKCWPGSFAFSITHGVTMARLIIHGKDYGPHHFMVQYRSLENFKPLPGIELGDIGLKLAYNRTDNGFCRYNQHRIPRDHMLMRNAEVLPDGTYFTVPGVDQKASYAAMVTVRGTMINWCSMQLAQAVTIAVRFSVVREQGYGPNNAMASEVPIFHYKHQHYRLLVLLSKAYAMHFMNKTGREALNDHYARVAKNDTSLAQWIHILLAGFKAWSTDHAATGVEDARRCCGGAGYLNISGLPQILGSLSAGPTFEGENYVMYQQVYRYLRKCICDLKAGKRVPEFVSYLEEGFPQFSRYATMLLGVQAKSGSMAGFPEASQPPPVPCLASGLTFLEKEHQLAAFLHRALRLVFTASALLDASQASNLSAAEAWNKHMMTILAAARAHTEYQILTLFHAHVDALPPQFQSLEPVLRHLASLFALSTIAADAGFLEDAYLTARLMQDVRTCIDTLLAALYPNAVALTDAFDFTDATLCSAIGCADGNAYERMLCWFRQMPINLAAKANGGVYPRTWEQHVKPILRAKL